MRDLKTTPVGVITYAVAKTKNILTTREKQSDHYVKEADAYRHYFEQIPLSYIPEAGMLEHLSTVQAGRGPDAEGAEACADGELDLGDCVAPDPEAGATARGGDGS